MSLNRKRRLRKTYSRVRGKDFVAGGMGRDGPFVTYVRRSPRGTYGKVSYGSRGPEVAVKHSGRRGSIEGRLNLSKMKPSFKIKRKSTKKRNRPRRRR